MQEKIYSLIPVVFTEYLMVLVNVGNINISRELSMTTQNIPLPQPCKLEAEVEHAACGSRTEHQLQDIRLQWMWQNKTYKYPSCLLPTC